MKPVDFHALSTSYDYYHTKVANIPSTEGNELNSTLFKGTKDKNITEAKKIVSGRVL